MESSGENLLTFMNNASSSVKTVLSKPGCFKRNTNHRRFLQKQLKQSAQHKTEAVDTDTLEKVTSPTLVKSKRINITKSKIKSLRKRKRRLQKVPCLSNIPSPTMEYNRVIDFEDRTFYPETTVLNMSSKQNVYEQIFIDSDDLTPTFSPNYQRSFSTSSYGSDDVTNDFMSGEDLVRSLDITDLFDPESSNFDDSFTEWIPLHDNLQNQPMFDTSYVTDLNFLFL